MESDVPVVAAMHLAYAATFDPSVFVRVALPASAAGVRALQRSRPRCHLLGHRTGARWCANYDVYRKLPRTPRRGTAVGVCPAAPPVLFPLLDCTLAYANRFPPTDDRSYGAESAVCVFAGLLLRSYPSSSPAVVRKLAERRVRLWEAGDALRVGFSVCGMQQLWRESRDDSELHNYHVKAGKLPATTSRSARRRKRRRLSRPRAASTEAAGGGADAAADGVPPAVVDAHRRAAKLTVVRELRRARQALDTANLGMVSDAASAPSMPSNCLLLLPARMAPCVFALHKDDPAAREEGGKSGEPLRVRPLGVSSVLVRLASAHALGQVGADAREVMGPVQRSFQSGAGCETAYMSMRVALQLFGGRGTGGKGLRLLDIRNAFNEDGAVYMGAPICHCPEWMTGALGRRREAHAALLERIASFGTSGYGCHLGAMRLLVVCAVRQNGFLRRMMPPSKLDPFLEAVDATNISASFSLLGLDAFQRIGAAASQLDTLRLYIACGPGSLSLFQSDHESARKIPHA
eukprot:jgi/Tetstr1/425064/TSEL_015528.t1